MKWLECLCRGLRCRRGVAELIGALVAAAIIAVIGVYLYYYVQSLGSQQLRAQTQYLTFQGLKAQEALAVLYNGNTYVVKNVGSVPVEIVRVWLNTTTPVNLKTPILLNPGQTVPLDVIASEAGVDPSAIVALVTARGNVFTLKSGGYLPPALLNAIEQAVKQALQTSTAATTTAPQPVPSSAASAAKQLVESEAADAALVAWVDTGREIDLGKAKEVLENLASLWIEETPFNTKVKRVASVEIVKCTSDYVEAKITLLNFVTKDPMYGTVFFSDYATPVYMRVYRRGFIVAWVPYLDPHVLGLLLYVNSTDDHTASGGIFYEYYEGYGCSGLPSTDAAILSFLKYYASKAGISIDLASIRNSIKHYSPEYSSAGAIELLWFRGWVSSEYTSMEIYGKGEYTVSNPDNILAASYMFQLYGNFSGITITHAELEVKGEGAKCTAGKTLVKLRFKEEVVKLDSASLLPVDLLRRSGYRVEAEAWYVSIESAKLGVLAVLGFVSKTVNDVHVYVEPGWNMGALLVPLQAPS